MLNNAMGGRRDPVRPRLRFNLHSRHQGLARAGGPLTESGAVSIAAASCILKTTGAQFLLQRVILRIISFFNNEAMQI